MNKYISKYKEHQIDTFFEKVLTVSIFVFIFSLPFNHILSKDILNQMFYFWILSLQFVHIVEFIKTNKIFQLLSLFMFTIWLSYLWSEKPMFYMNYINTSFKFWFLPILILITSMKKEYIKYYITVFIIGMFINEVISYSMYFGYIHDTLLGFKLTGNAYDPVPFQASHMEYSVYISFTVFLLLYALFHQKVNLKSSIYLFFALTMLTNLFLSAGRSGQFTFLVTSLLLILIYFRKKIRFIFISIALLFFTLLIAYNFSTTFHKRINSGVDDIQKVFQIKNYGSSFGARLSSYALLPEILTETPLLYGVGFNDTDKVIHIMHMKYFSKFPTFSHQEGHLHNTYITLYTALGVTGLLLLFYIFYLLLRIEFKDNYFTYLKYVLVFTIFFAGFTENFFREREIMLLFATFVSIFIIQKKAEQDSSKVLSS